MSLNLPGELLNPSMINIGGSQKGGMADRKQLKCGGSTFITKVAALWSADGQIITVES